MKWGIQEGGVGVGGDDGKCEGGEGGGGGAGQRRCGGKHIP